MTFMRIRTSTKMGPAELNSILDTLAIAIFFRKVEKNKDLEDHIRNVKKI